MHVRCNTTVFNFKLAALLRQAACSWSLAPLSSFAACFLYVIFVFSIYWIILLLADGPMVFPHRYASKIPHSFLAIIGLLLLLSDTINAMSLQWRLLGFCLTMARCNGSTTHFVFGYHDTEYRVSMTALTCYDLSRNLSPCFLKR